MKPNDTILKLAADCSAAYAAWLKLQAAMLEAEAAEFKARTEYQTKQKALNDAVMAVS